MITVLTQLLTTLTATGIITLVITHMHMDPIQFQPLLWSWHWLIAWPIAFTTVKWVAPLYFAFLKKLRGQFFSQ